MQAAEAALDRDDLAWSCYTALSALDFISREDIVRELVVITRHTLIGTSSSADVPMVSESLVNEFLQLQGVGVPEGYDEFVELHNRLIDWAIGQARHRTSAAHKLSPLGRRHSSPPGRSISHAATHQVRSASDLYPGHTLATIRWTAGPTHPSPRTRPCVPWHNVDPGMGDVQEAPACVSCVTCAAVPRVSRAPSLSLTGLWELSSGLSLSAGPRQPHGRRSRSSFPVARLCTFPFPDPVVISLPRTWQ